MKTQLAKQLAKNRNDLENAIRKALSDFTEETGVFVTQINYNLQVMYDADGFPIACEYYRVKTQLSFEA